MFSCFYFTDYLFQTDILLNYRVSPSHGPKRTNTRSRGFPLTQLPARVETIPPPQKFRNNFSGAAVNGLPDPVQHSATQTTLVNKIAEQKLALRFNICLPFQPKTRHQRPYGWENNDFTLNPHRHPPDTCTAACRSSTDFAPLPLLPESRQELSRLR